ncbi:hypothetical protein THAOC_04700 [Thalassiosira oceanica]|uniref:Nucleotide-diphospho-sugar transferase domain-containing protein n=1 Tax=Thalassiosira oceanica TaxID=159749 RepID=K0T9D5_THAOC|nr:hypothetical protein THAOC_04700 [Thalassiosira oceanica]|eukprot:EJK73664.1 hypothetical protein THAOC_04700 [Thalassiosira oceanica]
MAIIGNFESYHIQRWMRVDTVKSTPIKPELPLSLVSRGYASRGESKLLRPAVRRQGPGGVDPNSGEGGEGQHRCGHDMQSGAVCAANELCMLGKATGFDLGQILVFPTDMETKELAEGLGLTTYFDAEKLQSHDVRQGERTRFGHDYEYPPDISKVLCVLYPLMLNYDVLFQDADLVWLNDPVPFFHDEGLKKWDVLFQHDGSNSVRYAVTLLGEFGVLLCPGEQAESIPLRFAAVSFRPDNYLGQPPTGACAAPCRAQFSVRLERQGVREGYGDVPRRISFSQAKVFHEEIYQTRNGVTDIPHVSSQSWTENKDNKLLFLRQLGEWYLQDSCIGKTFSEIAVARSASGEPAPIHEQCCAAEPIFSCHYKDKPSMLPCKNSPSIDKGQRSFW